MSDGPYNERAGAAPTATGPDDTKAASLAPSDSANVELPPDEKPLDDGLVIDGAELLDRCLAFVKRFVVLPSDEISAAVILWAAHTHLMSAWETTPRLAFLSAEPGSGKSLAMRLTALLCPLALEASSATTSSLIRALEDPAGRPTYFIDEIDTKYGPKAKGDEQFRNLINQGHGVDGFTMRNGPTKDDWSPVRINTFAAIAMAGIGNILPATILTRSIVVKMRKRLAGEKTEPYRRRIHKAFGEALCSELAAWAEQVREKAAVHWPTIPDCIADRDEDVWGPLITVADLAGGQWPALAREAAIETVQSAKSNIKPSLGVQLLGDIQRCFGCKDLLSTVELLDELLSDEEAPWGDLEYHKKLDARRLAKMLDEYNIKPGPIRLNGSNGPQLRGYKRDDFQDAWARHLSASVSCVTDVTSVTDDESSPEPES